MRFAILLYQDEAVWEHASEAEQEQYYAQHEAFAKAVRERGHECTGEALTSVVDATTVRRSASDLAITEGPFAETAEQLGGLYLIDAPDLDEVIELVRLLPEYTIEIRRIAELD